MLLVDMPMIGREAPVREAFATGDLERATRLTFDLYARDVLSFLIARLRDEDAGHEAFAMFAEDFWHSLPTFAFRCSMRCWIYLLARNAALRYVRVPARRRERNLPLSQHAPHLVASSTRTATAPHHNSDLKQRLHALRELLTPDDQLLLILHVDRRLPFSELAVVLHDGDEPLEDAALARATARLRKRFERLKDQLRRHAQQEGLLPRS